jgi:hypothetical protein
MTARPGVPVRQRLRGWLGQVAILHILQVGFVIILATTALFGGLDTVDTKVTPFGAGEPFGDGQFTVTIDRAVAVKTLSTTKIARPKDGFRYLAVVATVRNTGTIPGRLTNEIDLRDHPEKEFIGVFRDADSTLILRLGPGLSESLVFVWRLPESALRPGTSITLRLWRKQFGELVINFGEDWLETDDYGVITLPVKVNE